MACLEVMAFNIEEVLGTVNTCKGLATCCGGAGGGNVPRITIGGGDGGGDSEVVVIVGWCFKPWRSPLMM